MRKIFNLMGVAFVMFFAVYAHAQQAVEDEGTPIGDNSGQIEYLDNTTYNVRVYPNPSSEFVFVNSYDLVGKSFIVTDMGGKAVAAAQTMNDNLITLNVSSYPSGLYFIRYEDGTLLKFIVKR